ncbi:hypothetical protein PMAYCL1PPCAC_24984, partial [Pristionchus mayeri]
GALIYRIKSTKKPGANVPEEDVIQLEDIEEPGNNQGLPTAADPPAAAATEPTSHSAAAEDPTVPDALTAPVPDLAEQADRGSIEVDHSAAAVIEPSAPISPLAEEAEGDIIVLDNSAPAAAPTALTTLTSAPTEREEIIILDDQPTTSRRALELPPALRHSHRRQKRVSESPIHGVLEKTITKRRITKNRKVTFSDRADSDITVLQQQPAAAFAHATYSLAALAAVTFLANAIAASRAPNAFYTRNSMAPHSKSNFKGQRSGRPKVITLSDVDESRDEAPPAPTAPVSSNSKEVEVIELDDEPEESGDPSALEEVPVAQTAGDQSDDNMVLDLSADVPEVKVRDLGKKATGDVNAEKIIDFSLSETIPGEGENEKATEVVDSLPLVNEKPKRRGGRPSKAEMLKRHQDEETAALLALVDMARDFPIDENQPSTSKACGRVSMGNRWSAPPIRFSPTWKKKK